METQKKEANKFKMIAVALTLALTSTVAGLVYYQHKASDLDKGLAETRLKHEKTLSEKLAAEKDALTLKGQLGNLEKLKKSIEEQLAAKVKEVSEKEKQLASYRNDSKKLKEAKKEIEVLNDVRAEMQRDVENLNHTIASINKELDKLKAENLALTNENKMLNDNVNTLCQSIINNSMTETLKKNGNLTVNARRTKSIKLGFDLPEDLSTGLTCKITAPEGKIVSSMDTDSDITVSIAEVLDSELTATLELMPGKINNNTKHATITWKAKEKLKPGVYQLEVFSGSKNLGKTGFRLK